MFLGAKSEAELKADATKLVYDEYTHKDFSCLDMAVLESWISKFSTTLKRRRQQIEAGNEDDQILGFMDF